MTWTTAQTVKLFRYFSVLDSDRNGYLERSDFEAITANLAALRRAPAGSPVHQAIATHILGIWERVMANADPAHREEGRATFADWLAYEAQALTPEHWEQSVNAVATAIFMIVDEDSDDVIGPDEFCRFFTAFRLSEAEGRKVFARMDADADGKLTRYEVLDRVREFHLSHDPGAPGNWLFGEVGLKALPRITLTPLQLRKGLRAFALMDFDHCGYVSQTDFALLGARYAAARGLSAGHPAFAMVAASAMPMWESLRAAGDGDGDGRATMGEWLAMLSDTYLSVERYDQLWAPIGEGIFAIADVDGDGQVGAEEWGRFLGCFGIDAEIGHEAFARMDRDGVGRLSRAGVLQAYREFHLSEDPGAPGNWFFGPF